MTNWMRRRIERSRARCDKAAMNNRTDKTQPQPAASRPGEQAQTGRNGS